ncbi:MAG: PilZ domain-containing protein [Deltaproteobacteria bacterium]|nr:PilZ domain-containing protein [Deltaproteobacteria bacterium]
MKKNAEKTLLVADFPGPDRQVLTAVLERLGYDVHLADNVAELNQALEGIADFSVVILRFRLLGDEAADRARVIGTPQRRVILLSDDPAPGGEMIGFVDLTENALLAMGVRVPEIVFATNDLIFSRKGTPRRKKRIYGGFTAAFRQDDEWVTGGLYNLSADGAFIETIRPPDIGSKLTVRFALPGHSEMEVAARVTWKVETAETSGRRSPPGVGVQFLNLTDEQAKVILLFVKGALGPHA